MHKDQVEYTKNILMESTNATLSVFEKGDKILLEIFFYKTDEMYKIFEIIKKNGTIPESVIPARFINRLFPSREEREARKYFKNGK
ncbi:hypothetical protein DRP44_07930 [candidate division TA06 bacterium]|uniref:Uncharacterized protein n=1 Tax=candidate division TA06 bacterium TaxID=2250710 RepID=A0A660S6D7_UNCT6|nr:MAG: hypothetical protein DRP44_07930 [candidate division TA06 bacterium]